MFPLCWFRALHRALLLCPFPQSSAAIPTSCVGLLLAVLLKDLIEAADPSFSAEQFIVSSVPALGLA